MECILCTIAATGAEARELPAAPPLRTWTGTMEEVGDWGLVQVMTQGAGDGTGCRWWDWVQVVGLGDGTGCR